jgi:hypothetical protein
MECESYFIGDDDVFHANPGEKGYNFILTFHYVY